MDILRALRNPVRLRRNLSLTGSFKPEKAWSPLGLAVGIFLRNCQLRHWVNCTSRRRLEMLGIRNDSGNRRACKCEDEEISEHLTICKEHVNGGTVKAERLKEANNIEIISEVKIIWKRN